jgi:hypothetical protein
MNAIAANQRNNRPVIVNNPAASTPANQTKKGWSGAAKGPVLGGLAGAGLGAATAAIIDSEKKKKEENK